MDGGTSVLVVRLGERVRAYEDACPHADVALSGGWLRGCILTCARHHWKFDLASGKGVDGTRIGLTSFAVEVRGDHVLVDVKSPGEP